MILVTGGAGFIGSHLVRKLLSQGHRVRVLDVFVPQVHENNVALLPDDVEIIRGDIRNQATVDAALNGVEVVFHQAAAVGVGQSMYGIEEYTSANAMGTATLLQSLVNRRAQVSKLIVASSMSVYGEGSYKCKNCGPLTPMLRPVSQFEQKYWELTCSVCGSVLEPVGTQETKPLSPASVYAITKQYQEELCLTVGRAYGIPTVGLRYFNAYGPGQALSNPYTGVAAIFSARLLNWQPPLVFEDGLQTRDFVHVNDIVQANILAMQTDAADYQAINVGTGVATTVKRVAELLAEELDIPIEPKITGSYREGDVRHCIADISFARQSLGYEPTILLEKGISELVGWAGRQNPLDDVERATHELQSRGLVR
jgi:dTDP-L-rhamnose 4-epimerase